MGRIVHSHVAEIVKPFAILHVDHNADQRVKKDVNFNVLRVVHLVATMDV